MPFLDSIAALGGRAHLYASATDGYEDLLAFLRAIGGRPHGNVVVPSYLPAKLRRASLAVGCSVRSYDVDESCAPDLGSLRALVDDETIAVLAVHYFGFPSHVEEVAEIARRRGAFVIEDCALTLGATHHGRPLGALGDAAIFSMRKTLLYSEGGVLRVGDALSDFCPRYERRVSSAWSLRQFIAQRAARLYARATGGAVPHRLVGEPVATDLSGPRGRLGVTRSSRFTERRLCHSDVARAISRRRANFRVLAEHLPETPRFRPLHRTLPDGVTPSGFPLLVRDGARDRVHAELERRGIAASTGWSDSPFDARHQRAVTLAHDLLELPVHQDLTDAQIERTLRAMSDLAGADYPALSRSSDAGRARARHVGAQRTRRAA